MLEQSFVEAAETKIEGKGSAANLIMIKRLDAILERQLEMTDTDRRFYAYSLRMMERFRAMGFAEDYIPKSNPSLWNNLHTATLEDFKLSDDESLRYTDEAIDAAKKQELEAFECVSGFKSSIAKLEQAVRQENLRDLLSVLAIGLAFPSIDTLFGVIDLKSSRAVNCGERMRNYFMRVYWLRAMRLSPLRVQTGESRNS